MAQWLRGLPPRQTTCLQSLGSTRWEKRNTSTQLPSDPPPTLAPPHWGVWLANKEKPRGALFFPGGCGLQSPWVPEQSDTGPYVAWSEGVRESEKEADLAVRV